jgi:hypothetical protein
MTGRDAVFWYDWGHRIREKAKQDVVDYHILRSQPDNTRLYRRLIHL